MSVHDEEDCEAAEPPEWAFSLWDMWGAMLHGLALILVAMADGLECFAREFAAAANHSRTKRLVKADRKAEERNRREMAAHLRDAVYTIPEEDQ